MAKIVKFESKLFTDIKKVIEEARQQALIAVNSLLLATNWKIGKLIFEIQGGQAKSKYGDMVIKNLSKKMESEFGSGYSTRNLRRMRSFYMAYPNFSDIPTQLSWSVCIELLEESDKVARDYYTNEAIKGNWNYRFTRRQVQTAAYFRIIRNMPTAPASANIVEWENQTPNQTIKDPYILEFLGIKENHEWQENELESSLIRHLQEFMMELGRGFTFVGRQKRITIDQDSWYIDLVFYNILLDCYVLIDLKTRKLQHRDIGQMQMYVNYYDQEIKATTQKPTIGLILCEEKNEAQVSYMMPKGNTQIFAAQYRLVLPTEEELKRILQLSYQRSLKEK